MSNIKAPFSECFRQNSVRQSCELKVSKYIHNEYLHFRFSGPISLIEFAGVGLQGEHLMIEMAAGGIRFHYSTETANNSYK